MEKDIFGAAMPEKRQRKCKEKPNIYDIGRAMEADGTPVYYNLSTALDKFATNVYTRLSPKVSGRFDFDFSANLDYADSQDIEKSAKAVKKAFCEKLEQSTKYATSFATRYYSLFGRGLISTFFTKEVEAGRLSESDYNLLQSVTDGGKTKLTENRDTKDKDGNVTPRNESLNITYTDNGRTVTVNYKVERSDIPDSDFPTIIAAYKISAKATNVNGRYDKANKPKTESVVNSVRRENEDLKAQLAALQAQVAALLAAQNK